jgi:HEAT repeat protein
VTILGNSMAWLVSLSLLVLSLQALVIAVLVGRNLWADFELRKHRRRVQVLDRIYQELEAANGPSMRRTLARREILQDVRRLSDWLDLVATNGGDPADITTEEYEQSRLVEKYTAQLRGDRLWTRRAVAAALLGWTGSPAAVAPLLACALDLQNEPNMVRSVALRALGRIRHPDAIHVLVPALASSETWLPPLIANCLVRIGRPAVPRLNETVRQVDGPITKRRWAAQILGEIGHTSAVSTLHEALSDVDPELRAKTAAALGEIAAERSIDPLLDRLLVDPIAFVRVRVAKALGELSTPRTIDFLIEALSDSEWWVRLRAVEALAHIGQPARGILANTLHDRNPAVARESARALERLGEVRHALEQLRREEYDRDAAEFLIEVGIAGNIEPLLDELDAGDTVLLIKVVRVLARIGNPRAGPALAKLLDASRPPALVVRVVDALRRCGDASHVESVLPLLKSDDEWVRTESIAYLHEFADAAVLPAALPLVDDESPAARESVLRLVEKLRPGAVVARSLRSCLDDPDASVRRQALRTLCACGDFDTVLESAVMSQLTQAATRRALLDGLAAAATTHSLPVLLHAFESFESEELGRMQVVLANAAGHEDVDAALVSLSETQAPRFDLGARWARAVLLGSKSGEETEKSLFSLTKDVDSRVRAAAVFSLRSFGDERSGQEILDAVQDESPRVVQAALRALTQRRREGSEQTVIECIGRRHPVYSVDAVFALAYHPSARAREALRGSAAAPELEIRLAALASLMFNGDDEALEQWLGHLQDPQTLEIVEHWRISGQPAVEHMLAVARDDSTSLHQRLLLRCSPFEAEQLLLATLDTSPDHEMRCLAIRGLETLTPNRVSGQVLSAHRRDPAPEVRIAALGHLIRSNVFGRSARYMDASLDDPVESIQVSAVRLATVLPRQQAIPLLLPRLETRRPALLDALADVLAQFMAEDPESVLDSFMGGAWSYEQMQGMVEVLRRVAAPLTTEFLEILLRHRLARIRAEAVSALIPRLGAKAIAYLRMAMDDPSGKVREAAIRCFRSSSVDGDPEIETAVGRMALDATFDSSPTVRGRAAIALADLKPRGTKKALLRLAGDHNERVVRRARRALRLLEHSHEEDPPEVVLQ